LKLLSIAAVAGALLAPLQAQAACKLTTVNIPVTMDGLRPMVNAKISGEPVKLVVDSGAFFSYLNSSVASRLKLKPLPHVNLGSHIPVAAQTVTSGAKGVDTLTGIVTAPKFEFAGGSFANWAFLTSGALDDASGLLGQNVLHALDDEYDFANGALKLVKTNDCGNANLVYWAKPGMTYSEAPLESSGWYDDHTVATVEINGVKMRAYFDTGADTSFITARAAARAGVRTSDPVATPIGLTHALDGTMKTWVAPFASVKIGDEEIKNTKLTIGESQATDYDILIGADFFLAHHVYVANSQGKIYFTYNGVPVFKLPEPEVASTQAQAK
jgi:predicted aspartyl protease